MEKFFKFFVLLVGVVVATVWNGYVLSVIWEWFMVGTFGLPCLTTVQAIGLVYVVGYLTFSYKTKEDEKLEKMVFVGIVKPALFLVIAWIVKLFM